MGVPQGVAVADGRGRASSSWGQLKLTFADDRWKPGPLVRALQAGIEPEEGVLQLVLEADVSQLEPQRHQQALDGVKKVIERRVNAFGLVGSVTQLRSENRLSVRLLGVKDVAQAKSLIIRTAQLEFREQVTDASGSAQWVAARARGTDGREKDLPGAHLRSNAYLTTGSRSGLPEVAFEFDDEGSALFEDITSRLIGHRLGIFLDGDLVSAPTVQAKIRSRGVITGVTREAAHILVIQLNSGPLPVPVSVVSE